MQRLSTTILLSIALLVPVSPAAARTAQPLVDLAPLSGAFADRVGPPAASARIAGDSPAVAYAAPDGQTVSVRFSAGYEPDAAIAQSYVDFLGGLAHGPELSRLRIYVATPREVRSYCGGVEGTLACYDPSRSLMTVPGEETAEAGDGVTTSYVIAHEYGHHVARHRTNAPFSALHFGPKRWASYERVCLETLNGRLAPGDEGAGYLRNPGEAWADTYAHLKYPKVGWQFTPLLRPSADAKAAALLDVVWPWTGQAHRTFRGRFTPGGPRTRVFEFELSLDGLLRARLDGPAGADYDLGLVALGRRRGGTSGPTADDVYATPFACREVDTERVLVKVKRRRGFGPFTLRISYAG